MRTTVTVTITATITAASAFYLYRKHRKQIRQLLLPAAVAAPTVEPDPCAICLEPPEEAVKTQCGHRFCLRCFRSWASRQVPPTSTARCPLCTSQVVRLTPEAWPNASVEALSRTRWLVGYNLEAALTVKLAWASRALEAVRAASGAFAIVLYVLSGHAWESAHDLMRFSFAPVPAPWDVRLRVGVGRWIVSAHILSAVQRFFQPPDDPRHAQLTLLLARIRPVALFLMATRRDWRHAKLLASPPPHVTAAAHARAARRAPPVAPPPLPPTPSGAEGVVGVAAELPPPPPPPPAALPPPSAADSAAAAASALVPAKPTASSSSILTSWLPAPLRPDNSNPLTLLQATRLCRGAYTLSGLLRLLRMLALTAHAAAPEAAHAHPLLLRCIDAAITVCEFVGVCMHVRIEIAGLRGLFLLMSWAESRGESIVRRVRPHESGLWSRRYCEVEELHYNLPNALDALPPSQRFEYIARHGTQHVFTTTRKGWRWEEALNELRVPLRALLTFYGERGLKDRGFPLWAVDDILQVKLPEDTL